jgi:HK97 family phage major capsid protein
LTEEMLEDTGVDLTSYIADKIGREIARTHNGLLVANVEALGTKLKDFTSNAAIAAGELEGVIGNDALGFYLEDASDVHWLMRSTTHWAINSITDDARFYGAQMDGLLGHDVVYSTKVDAIGSSGKSVMFGDWNYVGYREAPELRFIQDPYSVDGLVVLKYSFRACYGVLQAGAIGYGLHPQ